MFVLADYIIFFIVCLFNSDNGKEFIAIIVVDLFKASNPNCFIVTGHPRTPRDQGPIKSANKIVQQVLKSISFENCLRSIAVDWTKLLGQVMAVCNSHSGQWKHSVLSYEAVFGQKYHPQLKCNMSEMRECWSMFQRLKLSLDERLETYVRQHDIVDIEINHVEFSDNNDADDSDKDEGAEIGNDAFPELILEEDKMQLGNQYSNDGLNDTHMIDGDKDEDDGEEYSKEQPSVVDNADNINTVLVDNTPLVVVESPPVYCQITSDSPPPVVNEPAEEPTKFRVREYSTFTVQEAWDNGNIARYQQPLGTREEFRFLWPMLTCRECCLIMGCRTSKLATMTTFLQSPIQQIGTRVSSSLHLHNWQRITCTSPMTSAIVLLLNKSTFRSSFTLRTQSRPCLRASTSPFLQASQELSQCYTRRPIMLCWRLTSTIRRYMFMMDSTETLTDSWTLCLVQ